MQRIDCAAGWAAPLKRSNFRRVVDEIILTLCLWLTKISKTSFRFCGAAVIKKCKKIKKERKQSREKNETEQELNYHKIHVHTDQTRVSSKQGTGKASAKSPDH